MKRTLNIQRGPDGRVKIQKMDGPESGRSSATPAPNMQPQTAHQK